MSQVSSFLTPIFVVLLAVVAVLVLLSLLYGVLSHRFSDKIVAANMIGSLTLAIVVMLSVFLGEDFILDIGLVYALLSFLAVVVLTRVVTDHIMGQMRHMRDKQQRELTRDELADLGSSRSELADRLDARRENRRHKKAVRDAAAREKKEEGKDE